MVSRQAITKQEGDKGMPDIENLKALSQLLNVSIDYLLDNDSKVISELVIREAYSLSNYGKGSKKTKKDRVIQEKFPNAEIYTLYGMIKPTKAEKIIDNALGFLSDTPFGIPEFINSVKNLDKEFYMVNKDDKQFFCHHNKSIKKNKLLKFKYRGYEFVNISQFIGSFLYIIF